MSDIVEVRGVRIGEGIPKIIVPIVEATREEIIRKAESLAGVRKDIVEWRADWFWKLRTRRRWKRFSENFAGRLEIRLFCSRSAP